MTEKLYYKSSKIKNFTAVVLSCIPSKGCFEVILDKTAFFPEGGGQPADCGRIGNATVLDTGEINGDVIHFCDSPLEAGKTVDCEIDWKHRFALMQNHSGEHIVSGIVHSLYGYDNVGFHMSDNTVTVDFNGELSREQLNEIEDRANSVVSQNVDFTVFYPDKNELSSIDYRSKLLLTENVRLVKIGNVDICACCAPHVEKSGEIGTIKILDFTRHRGGTRLFMKCGAWAQADYREKYTSVREISNLLSVKENEAFSGVQRLYDSLSLSKRELYEFKLKCVERDFEATIVNNGVSLNVNSLYDSDMLLEFVDISCKSGATLAAAFSGRDGEGYMYAVLGKSGDMNAFSKAMNTALNGRGGGRNGLIQGRVASSKSEIIEYFNNI